MRDLFYSFQKITNFNIRDYIDKATLFFQNDYYQIENFISGKISSISPQPFITLKELQKENKEIFSIWQLNRNKLNSTEWFDLLDIIEGFDSRILTTLNLNKWLRTANNNFGSDNSVAVTKTLSQNETLERVAQTFYGSADTEGWVKIAKSNNLSELDYTIEGGKEVTVKGTQVNYTNLLTSIVDVINGKSIYGLDLDKKLQFINDDLKTLSYEDTIVQAVSILISLKQNDNPDEPSNGIQSSIIIGTNRNILNFPIIIRQMSETFASDDSLVDFKVENISIVEDKVSIDITVSTRDSTMIQKSVQF